MTNEEFLALSLAEQDRVIVDVRKDAYNAAKQESALRKQARHLESLRDTQHYPLMVGKAFKERHHSIPGVSYGCFFAEELIKDKVPSGLRGVYIQVCNNRPISLAMDSEHYEMEHYEEMPMEEFWKLLFQWNTELGKFYWKISIRANK